MKLKWFRAVNRYVIVFGACVLMVAFLLPSIPDMFRSSLGGMTVGHIHGEPVGQEELTAANVELSMLQTVSPILNLVTQGPDRVQWMLMKREAAAMGLNASNTEVDRLLQTLGADGSEIARVMQSFRVKEDEVYAVLRQWLTIVRYQELVSGRTHLSIPERLGRVGQAASFAQMGYLPLYDMFMEAARGGLRISEPMMVRFLADQRARVRIAAVRVGAGTYLDQITPPAEANLQALFEQHRDDLPGQGEPHGFGYKFPDRVQLEYLAFPIDAVRELVQVTEAEMVAYYDANADEFRQAPTEDAGPGALGEVRPYREVRERIRRVLTDQQAQEQADQLVRTAQAMLVDDLRALGRDRGYLILPEDFNPIALDVVAQRLQERTGFLPEVVAIDRWLDARALGALPVIGVSAVESASGPDFVRLMMSARELKPADDNPLLQYRMQVGVAGPPLVSFNGSRMLARLTAAEPAHAPASLAEVRDQVESDAVRLAAYQKLLAERDAWLDRARASLEAVADDLGVTVITPDPFPRQQVGELGGIQTPMISGIGQYESLVEAIFAQAGPLADRGAIANQAPRDRTLAVALDDDLSLYLVRIDDYLPMPRSELDQIVDGSQIGAWIANALQDDSDDPFSVEALSRRLGYVPVQFEDEDENADTDAL